MEQYDHWNWHADDQGSVWVEFDRADKSTNSLNLDVLLELEHLIQTLYEQLPANKAWKKVIFCSKKISGFIAGADILDVFAQKDHLKTDALIEKGQELFLKIESFPLPTIALIHGFCLGGGFELALACDWRIALEGPSLNIGLPEVLLGLQPGWGGSVRLPRLIGVRPAFDLILSGKTLKASQIKKLKVADYVIPERLLTATIESCGRKRKRVSWARSWYWALPPVRWVMGFLMRRALKAQKVHPEHYPAPWAIIEGWERYGHLSAAAFDWEVRSIQSLSRSSTAAHLVNVFRLRDKAKKAAPKKNLSIKKVHVIGAGVMGGDIAYWAAAQGYHTTLSDPDLGKIESTLKRAATFGAKIFKKQHEKIAFLDRLVPDPKGLGIVSADLIIEAVPENIELKKDILKKAEELARLDTIIASNTSTIPIETLATCLQHPQRLIGIHFFNPVAKMPLVEVIPGSNTDQKVLDQALSWVIDLKKLPLKVKSTPGFFVNRVLLPYILQALVLMQQGIQKELIDKSATEFGMPMGPLELADKVGLDVCLAALKSMGQSLPPELEESLTTLLHSGSLGQKTGQGLYRYRKGTIETRSIRDLSQLMYCQDRLVFALLNEVVQAYDQKVVASQDEADLACLFGFGFPPFRGGPFAYIKEHGVSTILQRFEACYAQKSDWPQQKDAWNRI